jgi:hypothetical protein
MHAYGHPRLLSDFVWGPTAQHRAVLKRDVTVDLRKGFRGCHEFLDQGKTFSVLDDDRFTILAGRPSDLCSPAIRVGRFWLGTPSGEHEALAAYVHDNTRAAMLAGCSQFTWKVTNDLFYDFLYEARSRRTRLYHWVVSSSIGVLYHHLNYDHNITCKCHANSSHSS